MFPVVACDFFVALTNGRRTYSKPLNSDGKYPVGTILTTSCDKGYLLTGGLESQTCIFSEEWNYASWRPLATEYTLCSKGI